MERGLVCRLVFVFLFKVLEDNIIFFTYKETFMQAELLNQIQSFHGHLCPGLAIGIQASNIALREIGAHSADEEVIAVVETDMCAVDAVQFLTGCTFGKGNLIFRDYGKNAFTFIRRADE